MPFFIKCLINYLFSSFHQIYKPYFHNWNLISTIISLRLGSKVSSYYFIHNHMYYSYGFLFQIQCIFLGLFSKVIGYFVVLLCFCLEFGLFAVDFVYFALVLLWMGRHYWRKHCFIFERIYFQKLASLLSLVFGFLFAYLYYD